MARSLSTNSSAVMDEERHQTTALVDSLLEHTRQLMHGAQRHTVAFSGGVDSSLVAYMIYANSKYHATAVLGLSPAVSPEQHEAAVAVAAHIGIPLRTVHTTEGTDPVYIANDGQACYACKTHLYRTLHAIHQQTTTTEKPSTTRNYLYNGTNADDAQDPTRAGLVAANEWAVKSPLAQLTKRDVRRIADAVGLPNAYTAAAPCLRSRLQWGVPATQDHLQAMGVGETFVREQMHWDFRSSVNMRVRLFTNRRICLQVDAERVQELTSVYQANRSDWDDLFLKKLGFQSLEIRPFKSGSVASYGEEVQVTQHTNAM